MKKRSKKIDNEEKDLLTSFKKDEWKSVKDADEKKAFARKVAAKTLGKDISSFAGNKSGRPGRSSP